MRPSHRYPKYRARQEWPVRLSVRTPGFQPGKRGSIPLRAAIYPHKALFLQNFCYRGEIPSALKSALAYYGISNTKKAGRILPGHCLLERRNSGRAPRRICSRAQKRFRPRADLDRGVAMLRRTPSKRTFAADANSSPTPTGCVQDGAAIETAKWFYAIVRKLRLGGNWDDERSRRMPLW